MMTREQIASAERFGHEFDVLCRQAEAAIDLHAACKAADDESQHNEDCRYMKFNISQLQTKQQREAALAKCDCYLGKCRAALALAEKVSPC